MAYFAFSMVTKKEVLLFVLAFDEGMYRFAGKLFGYSIIHRGPLPRFIHSKLYDSIVDGSAEVTLVDVVDNCIKTKLTKVKYLC